MSAVLQPVATEASNAVPAGSVAANEPSAPLEGGNVAGAEHAADRTARSPNPAGNVLYILSGAHLGAQVPVNTERLLVGNLESECDIVLDVGRVERHACLLRVSSDGWTVLSIAGDVWVESDHVAAKETRTFAAGQAVTLGRIAFAVGDASTTQWNAIKPPLNLVRPSESGAALVATAVPSTPARVKRWQATRLAVGLGIGALVIAAGLSYMAAVWQTRVPPEVEAARRLEAVKAGLAGLPSAHEMQAAFDPEKRGGISLSGYVADSPSLSSIMSALEPLQVPLSQRTHAVDSLASDLAKRVGIADASAITYIKQGVFAVSVESRQLPALDAALRAALLELSAVQGVRVVVDDVIEAGSGLPTTVVYRRSSERPSDILVDGADLVERSRATYTIREIRLGQIPSVLFSTGRVQFLGAVLPDGWILDGVFVDRIVLRHGEKLRVLAISQRVQRAN